ncbi:hypothetical protein EDM54_13305 [Brevibacillus borstelensis]|uniref:Uncharacterized protein n=1 Tax=Brevibacillus borstelensis AK1 TaxID=1300222 RepID=M8EEU8_9BACL|nr:hypothetical protein I532_00300 [Brevibacillus borstelensis AK1]KKX53844.1 hypothetical protein X546_15855 [Brevibacillus borstelensis cifa_chp40]RNB62683.1 hypothetical protein EDM54_13305 [Brevibacillus borstelensis]GED53596.1 hypothetical protein BBO01nite_28370 [Brevibacillus borstelensis]
MKLYKGRIKSWEAIKDKKYVIDGSEVVKALVTIQYKKIEQERVKNKYSSFMVAPFMDVVFNLFKLLM